VEQLLHEMLARNSDFAGLLEKAKDEEVSRQRDFFKRSGKAGSMTMSLSPERFLSMLYDKLTQDGLV